MQPAHLIFGGVVNCVFFLVFNEFAFLAAAGVLFTMAAASLGD